MYYSTFSKSNQCTSLLKLSTIKPIFKPVLPDQAMLFWHLPHIYCGGMAHRTGPVLLCNQGYDNLSLCLWFSGDTDDRWIPRTQGKQVHETRHETALEWGTEDLASNLFGSSSAYPEPESHLASLNQDCFNIASSVSVNHFPQLASPGYYGHSRVKAT